MSPNLSRSSACAKNAAPRVMMVLARLVVRSRKPTATTARIDDRKAARRTETSIASTSGRSSESWNVNSPPVTAKTPCAKLTMPVVR
jgi:hypothetical protein